MCESVSPPSADLLDTMEVNSGVDDVVYDMMSILLKISGTYFFSPEANVSGTGAIKFLSKLYVIRP